MTFGMPEILLIVGLLFGLGGTAFWVWMLVDCAMNESPVGNTKLAWLIVIACANFFGAVAYALVRRRQRLSELQQ